MTHEVFRVSNNEGTADGARAPVGVGSRCMPPLRLEASRVVHEPDPDGAPEGRDYYDAIRDRMHPFEAA
jgi:hypothetical protein